MQRLMVLVPDITATMAAGFTTIRVYTDTSETGTFATLDGSITLVASTDSYEYIDLDGESTTWYATRYYGVGPGQGALSTPRRGSTASAYATLIEARMDIDMASITNDLTVARALDGAARTINQFCGRPDGFFADVTANAKYYNGRGRSHLYIDECVEITEVAVKDSASDTTYTAWNSPTTALAGDGDWVACAGDPDDPEYNLFPWTLLIVDPNGDESIFIDGAIGNRGGRARAPGAPTVRVTARWGYSATIPDDIKTANIMVSGDGRVTIVQAARWYKRLQGGMSDTLASADIGQLMFRQVIDPDVALILVQGRYVVPTLARR